MQFPIDFKTDKESDNSRKDFLRLADELKGEMDGMQFSCIDRAIVREPTQ